jgi:hypothetical protein
MMHIVKLDKRYDGYGRFSHRVEFISYGAGARLTDQKNWIKSRNYLWTQFGPSAELHLARPELFDGVQPKWAWDDSKSAIYLKDESYTMFVLKWESWQNA